jgi:hypothetical protein
MIFKSVWKWTKQNEFELCLLASLVIIAAGLIGFEFEAWGASTVHLCYWIGVGFAVIAGYDLFRGTINQVK